MSTKIEWADIVWNPVTGCTKISEGCKNCYAEKFAKRLQAIPTVNKKYINGFKPTFHENALSDAWGWPKKISKKIFVCSMGDLFHENIHFSNIIEVLHVIKKNPHHTFIILTKRAKHMHEFFTECAYNPYGEPYEPLPNLWLGVTVENQKALNERIDFLLSIPAKVRFISAEPLLNSIKKIFIPNHYEKNKCQFIDWVICGGESGHGARPMHPDWIRSIRDQCQKANVPFFFKGWGEWQQGCEFGEDMTNLNPDEKHFLFPDFQGMYKCGKKKSGRLIDGKEYLQFPNTK